MSGRCKHGFHYIFPGDCDRCVAEMDALRDEYDDLAEAYDGGYAAGAAVAFGLMGMAEAIRARQCSCVQTYGLHGQARGMWRDRRCRIHGDVELGRG